MELSRFEINIPGEDIIKDNIFNKIGPVILFFIEKLQVIESHTAYGRESRSVFILAFNKNGIICLGAAAYVAEGVTVNDMHLVIGKDIHGRREHFADLAQFTARKDSTGLINDAERSADGIADLMN